MHRSLLNGGQVQRIHLDELGATRALLGIALIRLTIASVTEMVQQVKQLIEQAEQQTPEDLPQ